MTLEQKFDAVKNISPAWSRVTHFSWNDLIGMRDQISQLGSTDAGTPPAVFKRILGRLQAILADLQKGMKETEVKP